MTFEESANHRLVVALVLGRGANRITSPYAIKVLREYVPRSDIKWPTRTIVLRRY
jgi:hypothetical protein